MSDADENFINSQIQSFYRIVKNIANEEKRFEYSHSQIITLEDCMEDTPTKHLLVKRMVSWALKEFNSSNLKTDVRMLSFWKLLGKYSTEFKMEGVMNKVDQLGFFKTTPEFYKIWCEYYASQGDRTNFDRILKQCKTNCELDDYQYDDIFGPMKRKYFADATMDVDGDNTQAIFNFIAPKSEPISIHAQSITSKPSVNENVVFQVPALPPPKAIPPPKAPTLQPPPILQTQAPIIPQPQPLVAAAPQLSMVPQPAAIQPLPPTNNDIIPTRKSTAIKEEFSVFCEPMSTIVEPVEQQAPEPKKPVALASMMKERRVSIFPDIMAAECDITVAGSHDHEHFEHGVVTSTPRKSVMPGQGIMPDISLFNSPAVPTNQKQVLFGQNVQPSRKSLFGEFCEQQKKLGPEKPMEVGSSRKSLPNKPVDIAKAMPLLTITSAITEESEEKENALETTRLVDVPEVIAPGSINPWNDEDRNKAMRLVLPLVNLHFFDKEKCPRVETSKKIIFGGEEYTIGRLLGQGGFARVYYATSDNRACAIKYEAPACPWEVYICSELQQRLSEPFRDLVMKVNEAYVFPNASAIVYEYYPYGTLLDLSNAYKSQQVEMGGLLPTYFALQMAAIVEQVHKAKIIHADVKPDNFVIVAPFLPPQHPIDQLLNIPSIKLIDWGRSIDMRYFGGHQFIGRAGTQSFDCIEMMNDRPWNYQTDFYGFIATAYVLLTNEYMETNNFQGKIYPRKSLKRRLVMVELWNSIFEEFLNIPNCSELPSWERTQILMRTSLKKEVDEDPLQWKKSLERYNAFIKMRQE